MPSLSVIHDKHGQNRKVCVAFVQQVEMIKYMIREWSCLLVTQSCLFVTP